MSSIPLSPIPGEAKSQAQSQEKSSSSASSMHKVKSSPGKNSFIKLPHQVKNKNNNNNINSSGLVTVVQEQADNSNLVHILPVSNSTTLTSKPKVITSTLNDVKTLDDTSSLKANEISDEHSSKTLTAGIAIQPISEESQHPAINSTFKTNAIKSENPDSYLGLLRNKKSIIDTNLSNNSSMVPLNTTAVGNMPSLSNNQDSKLKKTTNPSIVNLRASIAQHGNNGTVSSTSTIVTKASSRAEFFAAKLHDAIKDDEKNHDDVNETFVYETSTNTPANIDQPIDPMDNALTNIKLQTDRKNDLVIKDNQSDAVSSQFEIVPQNHGFGSSNSTESQKVFKSNEDTFDTFSRSSINSKTQNSTQRKSLKNEVQNNIDSTGIHPVVRAESKPEEQNNHLRQITSRLFDSKGFQPRRYSGIEHDISHDSFDDDFDYYDNNLINTNHNTHQPISEYESAYEDELSQLNNPQVNPNVNNNHTVGSNINSLNFLSSNSASLNHHHAYPHITDFNDYGSTNYNDIKPTQKLRKKRTDIYNSPHDFTSIRAQRLKQIRNFCYTMIAIFLFISIGFISGFILATNKELQDVYIVGIKEVLISQEELVFDLRVDAFNPGLLAVDIGVVQLDIFAKSEYVINENLESYDYDNWKSYETILLGIVESFEVPLSFQGGFLSRQRDQSSSEIKIVNPCSFDNDDDGRNGNDGDNDGDDKNEFKLLNTKFEHNSKSTLPPDIHIPDPKWLNISRNPFDLIVRGAMSYKLPFSSQNHTVSINYSYHVDPSDLI